MSGVAILGYGVVGAGTAKLLVSNREQILRRTGQEVELLKIVDIRSFPGDPLADRITDRFQDVVDDADIQVVVETIGGAGIALEFTRQALASGRHVVTSNKELVAKHGPELTMLAEQHNVKYLFEASVGGGIPVIHPMTTCLAANEITGVSGILNGTTNYILSRMELEGISFDDALLEAQQNGFAEQNPQADIEGVDACRKIAILSTIAYEGYVSCDNIHTEGIDELDSRLIGMAAAAGAKVKLFARSSKTEKGIIASVTPVAISTTHPVSAADGVNNAVAVDGDAVGTAMFFGPGAGAMPTASAVVSDVLGCLAPTGAETATVWASSLKDKMIPFDAHPIRVLLRTGGARSSAVLRRLLDEKHISMTDVCENTHVCGLAMEMNEKQFADILTKLDDPELIWIRYVA